VSGTGGEAGSFEVFRGGAAACRVRCREVRPCFAHARSEAMAQAWLRDFLPRRISQAKGSVVGTERRTDGPRGGRALRNLSTAGSRTLTGAGFVQYGTRSAQQYDLRCGVRSGCGNLGARSDGSCVTNSSQSPGSCSRFRFRRRSPQGIVSTAVRARTGRHRQSRRGGPPSAGTSRSAPPSAPHRR
jgi:hypothetical protein